MHQVRTTLLVLAILNLSGCQRDVVESPHIYQEMAVAADHPEASKAGLEILLAGGNAVDAAVATSFALSVVRPYSCGIGGGGFMLIHDPSRPEESRTTALDYRERAPASVGMGYYMDPDQPRSSRDGVHAVGVPGTVAGLLYALENFGTLDREAVLAPAIRLAENGFAADANFVAAMYGLSARRQGQASLAEASQYLWDVVNHGGRLVEGAIITNPAQARALRLISAEGADAFYRGEIAEAIVAVMRKYGGPITMEDLSAYSVTSRQPLRGSFLEHDVLSMPPPSSGGLAILQTLGILEARLGEVGSMGFGSPGSLHFLAEALKHAFADRATWLGDPDFVEIPISDLMAEAYLEELSWRLSRTSTLRPDQYGTTAPPPSDSGTSHFSVLDRNGMAVACTETVNLGYGSLVVVPGFGFVLNNEMDDFTTRPGEPNAFGLRQSDLNLPEPGKRPLSSMSPTIVLRDDRVVFVGGGSGGPRIITATLQVLLNALMYDMGAEDAVNAPRFHHQWLPDVLYIEQEWPGGNPADVMRQYGHRARMTDGVGVVQVIIRTERGIEAASDRRKGGEPAGR